jgi:hypothetical protein
MSGVLTRKGNLDAETDSVSCDNVTVSTGRSWSPTSQRERAGLEPHHNPPGKSTLCHLDLRLQPSELLDNIFLLVILAQPLALCYSGLTK